MFFCKKQNFFYEFSSRSRDLAHFSRAQAARSLHLRENVPAEPEKVARPAAGDGREQKQAHLPVTGRHVKQEHGPERKQAKRAVEQRAENRAARMAARYAQHIKRQPERRAEPEPEHELRKLTEQRQLHPPNRRDQKPPPDTVSSV
mgnify:FL=1